MKGINSKYRPVVGEICLVSGPNCDDAHGYVFNTFEILWQNDIFVLYGQINKHPVLHKWEHIITKPYIKGISDE